MQDPLRDNNLIFSLGVIFVGNFHSHKFPLYLKLGYPKKALSMFDKALEIEKEKENETLIKLKIAQCYRLLNKKKDYLDLYNQISGLNDPFWSNLAKERIEELNFSRQIREGQQEEEGR